MRRIFGYLAFVYNQSAQVSTLYGAGFLTVVWAVGSYAAKQTAWIAAYGPIAWLIVGFILAALTLLLVFCAVCVWHETNKKILEKKFYEKTDSVNPLDPDFRNRRINIADLFSPYVHTINKKSFIDCELIGPANIVFSATAKGESAITGCEFIHTAAAITKNDVFVPAAFMFQNCTFIRTKLINLLIFVGESDYNTMRERMPGLACITPMRTRDQRYGYSPNLTQPGQQS